MLLPARTTLACFVVCLSAPGQSTYASNWEAKGTTSVGGTYSDNPTLRADRTDPKSASGTRGNIKLNFSREEANRSTEISPRISRNWYPDRDLSDAEHTNLYLDANTSLTRRRTNWNLGLSASDQGILTSEQTESADFLQVDDTRQSWRLSPSVSWRINEMDYISLATSYTKVNYEKKINTRSDYEAKSISAIYQHPFTVRQSVSATVAASNYTSERLSPGVTIDFLPDFDNLVVFENDTDGLSINLGYAYKWSDTTDLKASFGRQESDLSSRGTSEDGSQSTPEFNSTFKSDTYGVSINNKTESGTWGLYASQSIVPSSTGTPSESKRVGFRMDHKLTHGMTGKIDLSGTQTTSTSTLQDAIRGEREFWSAKFSLSHRLVQNISLTGTYTYKSRTSSGGASTAGTSANDATSHTVQLSAGYSFDI